MKPGECCAGIDWLMHYVNAVPDWKRIRFIMIRMSDLSNVILIADDRLVGVQHLLELVQFVAHGRKLRARRTIGIARRGKSAIA